MRHKVGVIKTINKTTGTVDFKAIFYVKCLLEEFLTKRFNRSSVRFLGEELPRDDSIEKKTAVRHQWSCMVEK